MEAMMNVPAEVTARRLRQAVVTRWNSVLEMISSLLTLKDEVNEALKRTGNFDLVVKSVDWNILHELCKVLVSFESLTDVASSTFIGLSVIPLIRAKVTAACGPCDADCGDISQLKRNILACVNKQFPMNDFHHYCYSA